MVLPQKKPFIVMRASITAVITTHNRVTLLPRALDSVLQQTQAVDEIIIVNDGSTDGTPAWLEQLDSNITVITQAQQGISAARNSAIRAARGEWLAFLDDDDSWLPDKLERQIQALTNNPEHRLCHGEEIWIRNGTRVNAMNKHQKHGGWIYPLCLPICVISPSAAMIHRSLFEDIGLFDEDLPACEDYDLWLRICSQEPVAFIDKPLITKYGGHEDQLSGKYWGMDRFRIVALEKILQGHTLSLEDRQLTLQTLARKITIYLKGARKRDKHAEVIDYQQRLQRYQAQLAEYDSPQREANTC